MPWRPGSAPRRSKGIVHIFEEMEDALRVFVQASTPSTDRDICAARARLCCSSRALRDSIYFIDDAMGARLLERFLDAARDGAQRREAVLLMPAGLVASYDPHGRFFHVFFGGDHRMVVHDHGNVRGQLLACIAPKTESFRSRHIAAVLRAAAVQGEIRIGFLCAVAVGILMRTHQRPPYPLSINLGFIMRPPLHIGLTEITS